MKNLFYIIALLIFGLTISACDKKSNSSNKMTIAQTTSGTNNPATVSGSTCYPSEYIPPLTVYARDVKTNRTYSVELKEDETSYKIKIPEEGEFLFFSWTNEKESWGAIYSKAVPCGLSDTCTDHTPILVPIKLGENISKIDICDYYSADSVPKP